MAQEVLGAVFQRMLSSLSMSVHQIGMLPNLMMTLVTVPSTVFRMSMVCSTDHMLAAVHHSVKYVAVYASEAAGS
jgi:hypothetical protein